MPLAMGSATGMRLAGVFRYGFAGLLLLAMPLLSATPAQAQNPEPCTNGKELEPKRDQNIALTAVGPGESQPDLEISGTCIVKQTGDYYYSRVNITKGGVLIFKEGPDSRAVDRVTNFWAKSIIVENGGAIKAGVEGDPPYGTNLHTLNIILYGKDQSNGDPVNKPAGGDPCKQTNCGVPDDIWKTNGGGDKPLALGNGVTDYFYQYGPIYGTTNGFYGYKVLAVGFGGTLQLRGAKGTTLAGGADKTPTDSGSSWARLNGDIAAGAKTLTVDAGTGRSIKGDWQKGDKIVVTTTDYLPSHSEELTITEVADGNKITVATGAQWGHTGHKYSTANFLKGGAAERLIAGGMNKELATAAETRAAVALLTRSIRIVSGGDFAGDYFDCVSTDYGKTWYAPAELSHNQQALLVTTYQDPDDQNKEKPSCATARNQLPDKQPYSFGGHTVFRQGFQKLQLQGVEFHQLGQGGRMAHYPVHFHGARQVPNETYIKDSSVSESMTRWYVLHSTQSVLFQRNIGWKSIGHGYYLEDGTEADNKFYGNIGIYARGGVVGPDNPRNIPGILAQNGSEAAMTYRSDVVYPTVFWITNGWNEFVGNMAAGAGTCGVCYWYLSGGNNDHVEVPAHVGNHPIRHMKWSGYAGRQTAGHEGDTPVKLFYKNYCSTAMHSLNTSDGVSQCDGVRFVTENYPNDIRLAPVKSVAPDPASPEMYYPKLASNRNPTVCDPSLGNNAQGACTGPWDEAAGVNNNAAGNVVKRCNNDDPKDCGITVIDNYTSSFHWAQTNFSAIWLRTPGWLMLDNSFVSDAQNGGLTFVSGGDYSRSSNALGYWALASNSVFVGATNPDNKSAAAAGPSPIGPYNSANPDANACDIARGNACISYRSSVAYPLTSWGTGQRMFNIYDGPAHQSNNAYLNIKVSDCNEEKDCMYVRTAGVRKYLEGTKKDKGYVPNAAIGWKQPNGFYYPPAFHSKDLYFNNVDIRHYVILPLFEPGTYRTNDAQVWKEFFGPGVAGQRDLMRNFTDVDRQTELNDDDGTLTGFKDTISVNEDGFFAAPIQAAQCRSNVGVTPELACAGQKTDTPQTARTSPYDYVTTVVYPACATKVDGIGDKPFEPNPPPDPDLRPYGACGSEIADVVTAGRFEKNQWRGGKWSRDCTAPFCFGVPIYRQYLTGKKGTDANSSDREWRTWFQNGCANPTNDKGDIKDECNFPFARMAGVNAWQRSVMTVNNGKFYIDTTRTRDKQRTSDALGKPDVVTQPYVECSERPTGNCQQRSVNVFEAGKTYLVFFVFAKKTTKQVYQIYVGSGFNPNDKKQLKGIKVTDTNIRYKYKNWDEMPWKSEMVAGPSGVKDVLQVTVDFTDPKVTANLDPGKGNPETCKPVNFCNWQGNTCGCNLPKDDARAKILGYKGDGKTDSICAKTCKEWAVKDLDCPAGGCLGFAFTLPGGPNGFKADDKNHRPTPEAIAKDDSVWSKFSFKPPQSPKSAGDCTYSKIPGTTAGCGVPDCPDGKTNPPFCDKP
jgi:hypothetical protein